MEKQNRQLVTLDPGVSIGRVPRIQFVASAHPAQTRRRDIVQQLQVVITGETEDGVDAELVQAFEEVFSERGGVGLHGEEDVGVKGMRGCGCLYITPRAGNSRRPTATM